MSVILSEKHLGPKEIANTRSGRASVASEDTGARTNSKPGKKLFLFFFKLKVYTRAFGARILEN